MEDYLHDLLVQMRIGEAATASNTVLGTGENPEVTPEGVPVGRDVSVAPEPSYRTLGMGMQMLAAWYMQGDYNTDKVVDTYSSMDSFTVETFNETL